MLVFTGQNGPDHGRGSARHVRPRDPAQRGIRQAPHLPFPRPAESREDVKTLIAEMTQAAEVAEGGE